MQQWVVTYRHVLNDGFVMVAEFYRGDHDECLRICRQSAEGEDDRCQTRGWRPVIGTAKSWDQFVMSVKDDEKFSVVGR